MQEESEFFGINSYIFRRRGKKYEIFLFYIKNSLFKSKKICYNYSDMKNEKK